MADRALIVNATAIGRRLNGITVYGIHLLRTLVRAAEGYRLTVVLNEDARHHFGERDIPPETTVRWVTGRMSPDRGTRGNLRRFVFANHLARQHRDALVFGLSQIEAPSVGGRGVVMVHDVIPLLFPDTHPRQHHFYRRYLGRALGRALAVITPSVATKTDLVRYYGVDSGRVHAIPHGCPVSLSAPTSSERSGDRLILWIGQSSPVKNLDALVAAFRMVRRRLPARLVIAGTEAAFDPRHGVGTGAWGDDVVVLGPVGEAEKVALLDRASVLACPSLYEGFGFAPLEAMARGCPVVAARTGALPEICGDAAVYVNPTEPAGIADALVSVLSSSALRDRLVERGTARARRFSWEASVRSLLAAFELAVPRHAGGCRPAEPALGWSRKQSGTRV